jgi:hypothetical protein
MLLFSRNDAGNFIVTQKIMGFTRTTTTTTEYTADLTQCRCNDEPFAPIREQNKEWFEKYYRKKFAELDVARANPKKVERLDKAFHGVFEKEHRAWCDANPDVTREERKAAYAETYDRIRPDFVTIEEIIPQAIR